MMKHLAMRCCAVVAAGIRAGCSNERKDQTGIPSATAVMLARERPSDTQHKLLRDSEGVKAVRDWLGKVIAAESIQALRMEIREAGGGRCGDMRPPGGQVERIDLSKEIDRQGTVRVSGAKFSERYGIFEKWGGAS